MQRVVFMGTPDYATTIFKALVESSDYEVVGLFTQEDKKVGRKQVLTPPHIKKFVLDEGLDIDVFQPKSLKDEGVVEILKALKPDFIVVAAYGQILPKSVLDIAVCINLHASILPKYRGASPIQDAVKNGDMFSGVTAMLMEEGLDSGDILGISYLGISGKDAPTVFYQLADLASTLTIEILNNFESINPIRQNSLKKSYSKQLTKSDGEVDFVYAVKRYQKYLAYIYWPGIYLSSGLKLKDIEIKNEKTSHKKGEILAIEKEFIVVGCESGEIVIKSVQPESKKQMNVVDYIRGKRLVVGDSLF